MFKEIPEVINFSGIQRMVADAIVKSDLDIRKELYNNIVVAGGNTLIPGLVERVQKQVPEIAPPNVKVKVITHMPNERKFSAWIGGSILSSLGSFQQMWMSRQEFEEHGAIMIERKCA
jgi:actin-related protein